MKPSRSLVALLLGAACFASSAAEIPKPREKAPDFSLKTLDGSVVQLSALTAKAPVVLVMLRGWPGYQCPICDRQVQEFIGRRAEFKAAGALIVFVYPGPAEGLAGRAEEFKKWKGKEWPAEFLFVLDPEYTMVNAYGLRWNAPRETAYPATFVIDSQSVIRHSLVSKTHGGRAKAADVLSELKKL